jgi:hypothetical protein
VSRVPDGFVECRVNFVVGDVTDLFGTAVEVRREPLSYVRTILGKRPLSSGNGRDTNLFVRCNRPAEQLFHRQYQSRREFVGSLY